MSARVLVMRAGSALGNNVIRSLRAGYPELTIVGCHDDRFVLAKSAADRNYAMPPGGGSMIEALSKIARRERIDIVIPTNDDDALYIAEHSPALPCRTFVPSPETVKLCHDKFRTGSRLRDRGVPVALTHAIEELTDIEEAFDRLRPHKRLWCRIREGSGSYGAIPVTSPEQVRAWILYWEEMRGVPRRAFTLSEYLPGRDYGVQTLWKDGKRVLTKMSERLTYMDMGSPSGVSSMPALAKTAYEPDVLAACEDAVVAVDAKASGVFFIDVKRSTDGRPCITEINAGRFAAMTNIYDLAGRHNMAALYVRLGLDQPVDVAEPYDYAEGYYFVRSIDTLPAIIRGAQAGFDFALPPDEPQLLESAAPA